MTLLDPDQRTNAGQELGRDRDGDGCSNLMEYATGRNPLVPDAASAAPQLVYDSNDGMTYCVWKYRRLRNPGGFSYTVQCSDDFTTWYSDSSRCEEVGTAVLNSDGFTETVTVRLLPAVGTSSSDSRQVRLQVTAP